MAQFLRLRKAPPVDRFNLAIGDKVEILDEDEHAYYVEVDAYMLSFTKEPDIAGYSYKTWFDLEE